MIGVRRGDTRVETMTERGSGGKEQRCQIEWD
jgi:hypothetical protein